MHKPYNKPNLQAPRHHLKTLNILDREFWKRIRKQFPQLKQYTEGQLRAVIWQSNIQLYQEIIHFRDGVELPQYLGNVFIGTCPKKIAANADAAQSLEQGILIEHRNFDSDMFLAKIFYTNYESKYRFKFHDMWTFKACRNFSRKVAHTYPDNWKKYIQVDHTLKISRLFRKERMRIKTNNKTSIFLQTYDEFEGF